MAVNSSAVSLRKPLAGGQREKTAKSTSVPPPFAIQVTRSSLPNSYLFCSRGKNAKNVIKSTSVLCHAAWTDGLLASFTRSSIVFSCYWTRIKSGSACAFLCTNNVCLFTRPDWRPSPCCLPLLPTELHVKSSSSLPGSPCSIMIFKASVEAWALSHWTGKDLGWASEHLGSGTGVICLIVKHCQILSPFLTLSFHM